MNKLVRVGLLVAVLFISCSVVHAAPLQYTNTRPVTIGSTWDLSPDQELQTLLTDFDVYNDQEAAGYWSIGGIYPTATPVVAFEITANYDTLQMGIFSDTNGDDDFAGRTLVDIFNSSAAAGKKAVLSFNTVTGSLTIDEVGGSTGAVNVGTFAGIAASGFGFYIQPKGDSGATFYSLDQLNNGLVQMVAFRDSDANHWTLCFEDLANTGAPGATDGDFNDFIFEIESIVPVPEPSSLLLIGFGLIGFGFAGRRKLR